MQEQTKAEFEGGTPGRMMMKDEAKKKRTDL